MGVTSIFDSTANSLKQITDSLYVSNYSHKAKITVNEKGTEAAAASHLNFIVCGVSQNPVKVPSSKWGSATDDLMAKSDLILLFVQP